MPCVTVLCTFIGRANGVTSWRSWRALTFLPLSIIISFNLKFFSRNFYGAERKNARARPSCLHQAFHQEPRPARLHFLLVANLAHPPLFFFPASPIFQPGGNAELCEDADSPRLFKRFQLLQIQLTLADLAKLQIILKSSRNFGSESVKFPLIPQEKFWHQGIERRYPPPLRPKQPEIKLVPRHPSLADSSRRPRPPLPRSEWSGR